MMVRVLCCFQKPWGNRVMFVSVSRTYIQFIKNFCHVRFNKQKWPVVKASTQNSMGTHPVWWVFSMPSLGSLAPKTLAYGQQRRGLERVNAKVDQCLCLVDRMFFLDLSSNSLIALCFERIKADVYLHDNFCQVDKNVCLLIEKHIRMKWLCLVARNPAFFK